jgi:hypothetical protein
MTAMTDAQGGGRVPKDTLAARLVLVRHEQGKISQRDAAEETGVPYGTWQGMEDGRATRNLDQHIAKIAGRYGYDRGWLMWGTQVGPHPDGGPDGGEGAPKPKVDALRQLTETKRRRHAAAETLGYPAAA